MEKKEDEKPSKEQACNCTKEELRKDYPDLKAADDCPVCNLYSRRCAIGVHRSEATPQQEFQILMSRVNALEQKVLVTHDDRLAFFSRVVRSSGKHSEASRLIRSSEVYNGRCAFCENTTNITLAHIVPGSNDVDYSPFSKGYETPLNVKSARNFLPLCGTLGSYGTCHNEFDKFRLTLLYRPFFSTYTIFCLDLDKSPKSDLHLKDIDVDPNFPPYRRLLAWRTRKCLLEYGSKMPDKGESLFELAKFSEHSKSVASDDEDECEDGSSIDGPNEDEIEI